ncbi:MAG: hypothetical protein GX892_09300 [Thermoanaerobacteraceae bacterium]|nr:hypothetical protein [Thermoanaerobacteraceae bacterium]
MLLCSLNISIVLYAERLFRGELMSIIKKVSPEQAEIIVTKRQPLGVFYAVHLVNGKKMYIGINNRNGHALAETFNNLAVCKKWLRGGKIRV